MSTYLTIQTIDTYRLSGFTHEKNGFTWRGYLLNAPTLEGMARDSAITGDTIREVSFDLDNSQRWFNLATEKTIGAIVTLVIDGYPETWMGKVTYAKRNIKTGVLSFKASEDQDAVLSKTYPHFFVETKDYTNLEADFVNKPIPTVAGGTIANPIRVPGMVVDRINWIYLFCVGEIFWIVAVNKAGTAITSGFTLYYGTADQPIFPGFVCVKFDADPRDNASSWPEVTIDIVGLKLGTHTMEECRNPMRFLKFLLTTSSEGINGWGLGFTGEINSSVLDQAIADCDTYQFKIDGILNDALKARVWIDRILDGCRGSRAFVSGKFEAYVDKPGASVKTFDGFNSAPLEDGPGDAKSRINRVICEYRYRYGQSSGKFLGKLKRDDDENIDATCLNEKKIQLPLVADHATAWAILNYVLNSAKYEEKKLNIDPLRVTGTAAITNKVVTANYPDFGIISELYRIKRTKIQDRKPILELAGYSDAIFDVPALGAVPADPVRDQALPGTDHILKPGTISNIVLTTGAEKRTDGTLHVNISGTFLPGRNTINTQIDYSQETESGWSDWVPFNLVASSSFCVQPVNPGKNYKFRLTALGLSGQSDPVFSNPITAAGSKGPADVTGFTAVQDDADLNKVKLSWNPERSPDFRYFILRRGTSWGISPIIEPQLLKTSVDITESANGTFTYLIKEVDSSGVESANATPVTITLNIYPPDVTNFLAAQNGENVLLTWTPTSSFPYFKGYEIREGSSWEFGEVVADCVTDNTIQFKANFERKYSYWIKAKTIRNKYSQGAANSQITIGNLLPKNYVVTRDEIASPTGVHFQTEMGSSAWTFDSVPGTFEDWPGLSFDDFPNDIVLRLSKTGFPALPSSISFDELTSPTGTHSQTALAATRFVMDKIEGAFDDYQENALKFQDFPSGNTIQLAPNGDQFFSSGYYTVRYDLGGNYSVNISVDWAKALLPASGSAVLEMRTQNDGSAEWSDWEIAVDCSKSARYVEFRMSLSTSVLSQTPEITKFIVNFAPGPVASTYYDNGYYIVTINLGKAASCDIAVDKNQFKLPYGTSCDLEYRYTADQNIWSAWTAYSPARKTFVEVQFKVNLSTSNNLLTPEVTRLAFKIDVPDVIQKGAVLIPIAGQYIKFPMAYNLTPTLLCTAEGSDVETEYYNLTNEGFFTRNFKRSDNTPIGGCFTHWESIGY